jgi:hypothetical protein
MTQDDEQNDLINVKEHTIVNNSNVVIGFL